MTLAPGEMATVLAEVRTTRCPDSGAATSGMFEATFTDSSGGSAGRANGSTADTSNDVLAPGQKVALFGKVEFDTYSRGIWR